MTHAFHPRRASDLREADGRELRLPLEDEIGDLHVGIARQAAAVAAIRLAVAVRVVPDRNDVSAGLLDRHADLHAARTRHRDIDAVEPFALFQIVFVGVVDLDAQRARMRLEPAHVDEDGGRSEEHTSELQSLMRISYAVFCLKKKTNT